MTGRVSHFFLCVIGVIGVMLSACVHSDIVRPDMSEAPDYRQEYRIHWDSARGNQVNTFTVSNNGKYIVAGGEHYGVRLYDVKSRRLLREFIDPSDTETKKVYPTNRGIYSLQFSADDTRLISGGENSLITVWEVKTGKVLKNINLNIGQINAMALSRDSKLLAIGTQTGELRIYDLNDMSLRYSNQLTISTTEQKQQLPVKKLAFSQRAGQLAIVSMDERFAYLWKFIEGKQLQPLVTIPWGQQRVGESLQGNYFASSTQLWDLNNHGTLSLEDQEDTRLGRYGTAVSISADQSILVRGDNQGYIHVWDLITRKLKRVWRYSHRSYPIDEISILPDNKTIVVIVKRDHTISFRNLLSGDELLPPNRAWEFASKPEYIYSDHYILSADGNRYVMGLQVIDTKSLHAITDISVEDLHVGGQQGVAISTDNRLLASSLRTKSGNYLAVWELDSKQPVLKVAGDFTQTAFTNQNKNLLYLDREYRLHNISLATAKEVYVIDAYRLILEGKEDLPRGIDMRVVGNRIFIAVNTKYDHGYIAIHDVADGRRLGMFRDSEITLIRNFAVSNDGRMLAVCSKKTEDSPTRLLVLDTRTGKRLAVFPDGISPALLAFTPDQQMLLVISTDQIGHYWDLQKNTLVQQTRFGWERVSPLRISNPQFSPDGARLYENGTIWDIRSSRIIFPPE